MNELQKTTVKDLKLTDNVVVGISNPITNVEVTQTLASGTKIGTIKVNDTTTTLYAPTKTTATELGLKDMAYKGFWVGDLTAYNALTTKDSNTLYFCQSED